MLRVMYVGPGGGFILNQYQYIVFLSHHILFIYFFFTSLWRRGTWPSLSINFFLLIFIQSSFKSIQKLNLKKKKKVGAHNFRSVIVIVILAILFFHFFCHPIKICIFDICTSKWQMEYVCRCAFRTCGARALSGNRSSIGRLKWNYVIKSNTLIHGRSSDFGRR